MFFRLYMAVVFGLCYIYSVDVREFEHDLSPFLKKFIVKMNYDYYTLTFEFLSIYFLIKQRIFANNLKK